MIRFCLCALARTGSADRGSGDETQIVPSAELRVAMVEDAPHDRRKQVPYAEEGEERTWDKRYGIRDAKDATAIIIAVVSTVH